MTKPTGNMVIAQSGGPTAVINQSLIGALLEAKKHREIKGIYGALHGIKGVLEDKLIDLRKESLSTLEAVHELMTVLERAGLDHYPADSVRG